MSLPIEVVLRIPPVTTTVRGQVKRIDNRLVRFCRRLEVATLPKVGDTLVLDGASGATFTGKVTRCDWRDDKDMFVVACSFAERPLTADTYDALVNHEEWTMIELPA